MKSVSLPHDVNTILSIVSELRSQGYVQGVDFDFAWHQSKWDNMIGEIPKNTVFTFYTEEISMLFALKYS